jgi:uncharacterized OB-fold protein
MSPLEKINQNLEAHAYEFSCPVTFTYTVGIALERFFREIKDNGRIMGTKCNSCNLIYVPAALFCERCFETLKEYVEVPGRGTVYTFTMNYEDLEGKRLKVPTVLAMVQIEGVQGGLIHRLVQVDYKDVKIGMPVEIVFKPKKDRVGSILDIEGFKPI